jgi:hypothetical protein
MSALGTAGSLGGAAIGNMILPGVGGWVGGALGGALGNWAGGRLFGGGGGAKNDPRSLLLQRMQQRMMQPFDQTATYQAGRTQLTDALGEQGQADAARVAAMGGQGGEADVAMAGARGQALASGLTRLVGQADQQNTATAGQLLGAYEGDRQRSDNSATRRWGAFGQALSTAAQVAPDLINRSRK